MKEVESDQSWSTYLYSIVNTTFQHLGDLVLPIVCHFIPLRVTLDTCPTTHKSRASLESRTATQTMIKPDTPDIQQLTYLVSSAACDCVLVPFWVFEDSTGPNHGHCGALSCQSSDPGHRPKWYKCQCFRLRQWLEEAVKQVPIHNRGAMTGGLVVIDQQHEQHCNEDH